MHQRSKSNNTSQHRSVNLSEQVIPRLPIIDLMRGVALLVMAIFHFSWDLTWFNVVTWQVTEATSWILFRISIASSFLFLTGISLTLAHGSGINFRPFMQRFLIISLCAIAISLITWYVFPQEMVRFGILHCIAFSSVAGLIFLRLPKLITLLCATIIAFLPLFVQISYLDHPNLSWIGLITTKPETVDFVPIFPWFAAPLYGIACTKYAIENNWHLRLAKLQLHHRIFKPIQLFGRHSLLFYMVHQPIIIGIIWLAVNAGLGRDAITEVEFHKSCLVDCRELNTDYSNCPNICTCLIDRLQLENNWNQVLIDPKSPQNSTIILKSYQTCDKIN